MYFTLLVLMTGTDLINNVKAAFYAHEYEKVVRILTLEMDKVTISIYVSFFAEYQFNLTEHIPVTCN